MGRMSDLIIGEPGYLVALQEAYDINRDADGRAFGWRSKGNIAKFKTIVEFIKYVDEHIDDLDYDTTVAASGSSSTIAFCSDYLNKKFKERISA